MYLSIYQTSSPSYVLMAGIDQCISLLEEQRVKLFAQFDENRQQFLEQVKELKHIQILNQSIVGAYGVTALDVCKLVISVHGTDCSGQRLYETLLHEYGLQMEMAAATYVLAILTIMDTEEGFDRLAKALLAIDKTLHIPAEIQIDTVTGYDCGKPVFSIGEVVEKEWEACKLATCENRIAADYICVYPPGIPLIVPGEQFTSDFVRQIEAYQNEGLCLLGVEKNQNTVKVVK